MEPLSTDKSPVRAAGTPLTSAPSTGARPTPPEMRLASDLGVERPVAVRLGLQRRAPANLRRHLRRAIVRFGVLAAADLAAFGLMRALIRAVRDYAVLGVGVAGGVGGVVPRGYLNGWQFAVAMFVGLLVMGNYGPGDRRRDPGRLFAACALAAALPLWMTIWTRGLEPMLVQYAATAVLLWLGLVAERRMVDRVVTWARRGSQAAATLFVGPAADCRRAMTGPAFGQGSENRPVGFVDTSSPAAPDALGHVGDFSEVLAESGAEAVVACGHLADGHVEDVVEAARFAGCQLLSVPRAWQLIGVQPTVVWKNGQPLIELAAPVVRAPELFVKRVMDFLLSAATLVALAPLIGLAAVFIKLDSPGPVLFGSERWGRGGRRIRIWKFRTMVDGASHILDADPELRAEYDREVKLQGDPRITRVGRWLRRWSIDELPQLFNVVIGQMSLVGPRPKLWGEERRYGGAFDIVLSVPPGVTGLWQVSGRSKLSYEERVALDVEYVRRRSLWLDLRILLQTVPVVLRGVGAH